MPIFQVTPLAGNAQQVAAAVSKIDPGNRYALQNNAGWLVAFQGTSSDLSNFLQVTALTQGDSMPTGSTLVTHIVSYFGLGPTGMWEWLKIQFEANK